MALHDLLRDLKAMSCEAYLQEKATIVYMLRDFSHSMKIVNYYMSANKWKVHQHMP